jgi:phosphoribosylformylglycinamidine synthase
VTASSTRASLRDRSAEFGLTPEEYDRVVTALGREPNVTEAGVFGALWSEHCGYKNSRPLLGRLPTVGERVVQGPGENAGVVDIGEGWAVAFKMESHNHPSAVEPVQGAATGVGGILRDIFAMGARPVAVLDSLRFGELTSPRSRHLLAGVVAGISSYGNAVGVPTVGGEVEVNPCYEENPLVNVMAVGLLRRDALRRGTVGEVGNRLYYVGSKTGRDGLGGAVFASADLSEASEADRPAVQVGDPFLEKLLLEACLEAMERDLVAGVQDMGAAGLSSSVAEMAHRSGRGVDLHVDRVPRREEGMTPLEVMLSESQERMMLAARPGREEELRELFARYGLDAVEVGVVRDHGELRVIDDGRVVAALPVRALNEPPTYVREGVEDPAVRAARERDLTGLAPVADPGAALLALLAAPAIASKEPVFRRYDHQVMTNTVVLPGRADAAVLRVKGTTLGVAATVDCDSRYTRLDPRLGAAHAVAEAARNLSCVGAEPVGVTDNLNFGNPTDPHVYFQLERSVEGIREACLALGTPVTGGNVSLYNQYVEDGRVRAVHPTPTIGMVGVLRDVTRRATQELKRDGDALLLLGAGRPSVGASEYLYRLHGLEAGAPPHLDLEGEAALQSVVRALVADGVVDTAHDVSTGGLAVCLAEMAVTGGRGLSAEVPDAGTGALARDVALFGESSARVVVAVEPGRVAAVESACAAAGVPSARLGHAGGDALTLSVRGDAAPVVSLPLADVAAAWGRTFAEALG